MSNDKYENDTKYQIVENSDSNLTILELRILRQGKIKKSKSWCALTNSKK